MISRTPSTGFGCLLTPSRGARLTSLRTPDKEEDPVFVLKNKQISGYQERCQGEQGTEYFRSTSGMKDYTNFIGIG